MGCGSSEEYKLSDEEKRQIAEEVERKEAEQEKQKRDAEAKALAEAVIEIKIETDEPFCAARPEVKQSFTEKVNKTERAADFVHRLFEQLEIPKNKTGAANSGRCIRLEFNGQIVELYGKLEDAGIKEGDTVRLVGVAHIRCIRDDNDLYTAVSDWFDNQAEAETKYGHISDWDISDVTTMRDLFKGRSEFNEDLSKWEPDGGHIPKHQIDISGLFDGCDSLEKPRWFTHFYEEPDSDE